jgi:molecular chaperone HtpG
LPLYAQKEVLIANSAIDTALISFLEQKLPSAKFQRIDGGLDDAILDSSREKTVLDGQGKTEAAHLADFFRSHLNIEVEAKSLNQDSLPAILMLDEQERRWRDYLSMSQQAPMPAKTHLVVNTNNPLISTIYQLKDSCPDLAKQLAQQVYDLSLLAQKELEPSALPQFISRSQDVLKQMAQALDTEKLNRTS